MAQGPIFSGELDPDIAALIGGQIEEVDSKGKPSNGQSKSSLQAVPALDDSPVFDQIFGDMDLTGTVKGDVVQTVDLTKRKFAAIPSVEAQNPSQHFANPDFYKIVMSNGADEAQTLHQALTRYVQCSDPKDKAVLRQKVVPAWWNFVKRLALQVGARDFPVQKQIAMRFGALLPAIMSPENKSILERVIFKNETGEPVFYIDEWFKAVAAGQLKASATDEVKLSRMDESSKYQNLIARSQGKRDSAEGILKARSDERRGMEKALQEKVSFLCQHDSQPGLLHVLAPYTEAQKKGFSEIAEIMRSLSSLDRDLQRAISDFEDADKELSATREKAMGLDTGETVKANLQSVAQEFETVRQMAKMTIGRQGNHFPLVAKEYLHLNIKEMGTRENVIQAMAWIESIDAEAFCRTWKNQLNRVVPYVVLIPGYGDYGICWEPFDRYNRATGRGRIAIPMYPKNLGLAVITAVADLRWQTAKEKASYYWMEEGLTGNYYQWFVSKKLKGDVKEYFIADYLLWISKEAEGVQKLDKEVRQIFWRYMPFQQAIKDKLKTRALVYQELCQKDMNRQLSDGY